MRFNRIACALMMFISTMYSWVFGGFAKAEYPQLHLYEKQIIETGAYAMNKYDLVLSPDGSDSSNGKAAQYDPATGDGPLKTIERAQELLRELKKQDPAASNVTVWLRGGTYCLESTLRFNSEDMPGVTFCAYQGETPVISGAFPVSGWHEEQVNGITVWSVNVNKSFNALYSETHILPQTRYPETGYLYVKAQNTKSAMFTEETTPWSLTLGERAFDVEKSDLENLNSWKNLTDITVRVLHFWKDEQLSVESYDSDTGTLYFNKYNSMSTKAGDRYFLENVFEALNSPGEWYLDKPEGKLYYVPQDGENIETTVLYASSTEYLLDINGVDGISFKGITWRDSGWHVLLPDELENNGWVAERLEHPQAAYNVPAAMLIQNARGISFDACRIINIGFTALKFGYNVQESSVTRCLFQNIGANAVFIHGENVQNEYTNTNINVTDNHIYKYGRQSANAIGVLLVHANHCQIANNEIHDGYYTAISVGWVWGYTFSVTDYIDVTDNLIYDIGQGWLSDMGGIYTLGTQKHTHLCGNVIHDVAADSGQGGYGGWGIYLDEGSSGITVEKNLAYFCGSNSFHQHYGRLNIVKNNIFALSKEGQIRVSRKEDHVGACFINNIVVSDGVPIFYDFEYGKLYDVGNIYWDYTRGSFVLSQSTAGNMYVSDMKRIDLYADAVFKNPWFKDAKSGDFTLAVNSPALALGFEAWDYGKAGTVSHIPTV